MQTEAATNHTVADAPVSSTLIETALDYASRGLPVFPCVATGPKAKKPHTQHGFKDATTDPAQITNWWSQWPDALIGMPTGPASRFVVLDVDMDPAKDKNGEAALQALLLQHGQKLPETGIVRTPRGGRHIYFQHPGIKVTSRTDSLGRGLDVRGDGGYVIVPPSQTQTGAYTWVGEAFKAAPLPTWLCDLMVASKAKDKFSKSSTFTPPPVNPASGQTRQTLSGDMARLSSALAFIPATDRTVWRDVGFGIKHHFGDAGWQIFDDWSKTDLESYDAEQNLAQWNTFKSDGGVTIGTVFHLAKKYGWVSERAGNENGLRADYVSGEQSMGSATNNATADSFEKKPRVLTLRSPDELLAMKFDDSDIILGDRIIAGGQPVVIAGAGGTGKSRLALQMIGAIVTGRRWLNFITGRPDMHWLILQTENSNRRLQQDLARIKAWLGEADWARFAAQVVFHTLEHDDDGFVSLDAPDNRLAIQNAIETRDFGAVVIDPLNDFASGDLNKDADMKATLQILSRLCRRGNPDRALVVLHHALTGKAGAVRATGHDRASFARNSKTLHAWTRGQINLAAVDADSNDRLIVACGKCSNGKEFPAFGIALNPETMIYNCDATIDVEVWATEMGGKAAGPDLSPVMVAGVVKDLAQATGAPKKPHLVKALRDETGCSSSGAYNAIERAERAAKIRFTKTTKSYATT